MSLCLKLGLWLTGRNTATGGGGGGPTNDFLLMENGDALLLESGDKIILE